MMNRSDQSCRTSQEVRGLKPKGTYNRWHSHKSHLARGAWIETKVMAATVAADTGRTSQEVRGLKLVLLMAVGALARRTSQEVRGLKR